MQRVSINRPGLRPPLLSKVGNPFGSLSPFGMLGMLQSKETVSSVKSVPKKARFIRV